MKREVEIVRWLCKVPREKRVAGLRSTGASIEDGDVACSVHGTISLPGLLFTAGLLYVHQVLGRSIVGSGRGNVAEAGRLIGEWEFACLAGKTWLGDRTGWSGFWGIDQDEVVMGCAVLYLPLVKNRFGFLGIFELGRFPLVLVNGSSGYV